MLLNRSKNRSDAEVVVIRALPSSSSSSSSTTSSSSSGEFLLKVRDTRNLNTHTITLEMMAADNNDLFLEHIQSIYRNRPIYCLEHIQSIYRTHLEMMAADNTLNAQTHHMS